MRAAAGVLGPSVTANLAEAVLESPTDSDHQKTGIAGERKQVRIFETLR